MARKVHIQFLWTDESVMLEDFGKKVSKQMLEWANEFYKPYGIELEAKPAPNVGTVALAQKFALVKNDGIQPDMDDDEEMKRDLTQKYDEPYKKLEMELAAKQMETERKERERQAVSSTDFSTQARLSQEVTQLYRQQIALLEQMAQIRSNQQFARMLRDYDTYLRIQMMDKFVMDKIGGNDRVNVVFAKFKQRAGPLTMRDRKGWTVGITRRSSYDHPAVFILQGIPRLLWPNIYIVLDIQRFHPSTLAHEIVHTVGESHPDPVKVIKNLEKLLNYRPPKPLTMLNRIFEQVKDTKSPDEEGIYKVVDGGYFDGPDNDIMNYSGWRMNPSDYILPDDKKKLFFDSKAPYVTD